MITRKVSSKGSIRKTTNNDIPFSPAQPVLTSYYATSTASQTVINLTFSVDQTLTDQFFLFVDGKKLTLGSSNDYTFTSIDSTNFSSQITLTQSLSVNLNIQAYKLGLKKESEFGQDNRIVAINSSLSLAVLYPTLQRFVSGSGTYNPNFGFIVSSANATLGATYTFGGTTYTVYSTVASATVLYASGNAAPSATSGTLTKTSGTGDSTIQFSNFSAPKWLRVRLIGGGGGGAGGGTAGTPGSGTAGGSTTFGSSLLTAGGGGGGTANGAGGTGGGASISAPAVHITSMTGNRGGGINYTGSNATGLQFAGGAGGAGPFGGGTDEVDANLAGRAALSNSGSGGGGGSHSAGVNVYTGSGGGAGAYLEAYLYPTSGQTYAYSIGAGNAGGGQGTSGFAGAAGGSGLIIVEEFYVG